MGFKRHYKKKNKQNHITKILNLEKNKLKKSQKQKMSDSAKKEDKNTEIPSQTFNTQLNFLMENELNAIDTFT